MVSKLFIGGLSMETTEAELRAFFEQAGTVSSATVATDQYSGRSKGFGFVEMATGAEAQKALTELNGKTLNDREIRIEQSKPSQRGGGGGGRSRGRPGGGGGRGRW